MDPFEKEEFINALSSLNSQVSEIGKLTMIAEDNELYIDEIVSIIEDRIIVC
jgi:hypothetical protein